MKEMQAFIIVREIFVGESSAPVEIIVSMHYNYDDFKFKIIL